MDFNQNKESKIQETKQESEAKGENEKISQKQENPQNSEKQKIVELTETLQRLQAEFENFQKRSSKQNDEFKQYANADLISQILPVLDTLEQGSMHNKELIFVYEQLYSVLKKKGLEKIAINLGTNYNHETMDCLMQEVGEEKNEGKVAHILISGYLLNGKVLRAAKVSVYSTQAKECGSKESAKENSSACECEHDHECECDCGDDCQCGEDCDCDDSCNCEKEEAKEKKN